MRYIKRNFLFVAALFLGLSLACSQTQTPLPTMVPVATVPATPLPVEDPDLPAPIPPAEEVGERPLTTPPPEFGSELEALHTWLYAAWAARANPFAVYETLVAAGWQTDPSHLATADLTGDGHEEWLLSLCVHELAGDGDCHELFYDQMMGDLWVIGASGLLYQYSDRHDIAWQMAPVVLEIEDFTGDGRSDALIAATSCGAHTCFQHYLVLSAHYGPVANVLNVAADSEVAEWSEGSSISYSTYRLSDDVPPALILHGGMVGSAGAGIHRAYSETWQWDGEMIAYRDFAWDASNYRFHRLYDANWAWQAYDLALAREQYEQVIFDDSLEDIEWSEAMAEELAGFTRQFAAFRLALLELREENSAEAAIWQSWLREHYPSTPFNQAADLLMSSYAQGNELASACIAVTNYLLDFEQPLGPLHYMGYANPILEVEDVCPLD